MIENKEEKKIVYKGEKLEFYFIISPITCRTVC